jgi:hypothetical protein
VEGIVVVKKIASRRHRAIRAWKLANTTESMLEFSTSSYRWRKRKTTKAQEAVSIDGDLLTPRPNDQTPVRRLTVVHDLIS